LDLEVKEEVDPGQAALIRHEKDTGPNGDRTETRIEAKEFKIQNRKRKETR
jgi:hypothetical protein